MGARSSPEGNRPACSSDRGLYGVGLGNFKVLDVAPNPCLGVYHFFCVGGGPGP